MTIKVFTAIDVLLGKKDVGNKTVVVGGGLVGCELALDLAKKGKEVTIVEALNKILAINGPLCSANSEMLEKLIPFNNIDVKTNSKVKAYKDGVLEMETDHI
jgi:2-enoate reductase